MFRIDDPTAAAALPSPAALGTEGYFTEGDPGDNTPATIWTQDFANMVQESLIAFLTAAGVAHSKSDYQRLLRASTFLFGAYLADTGAANAYVVSFSGLIGVALPAHVVGMPIRVKWANGNTGASTFNPGPGAVTLARNDGTAVQGGDVVAGAIDTVIYDGTVYRIQRTVSSQTKSGHGQCQLQLVSTTQIKLVPKDGCNIVIGGTQYQIPATGVTIANTSVLVNGSNGSLSSSTVYYVSLYNNGGTLTGAFWAAASYSHMPDTTAGNVGVEVISSSGSPTTGHTLIGLIATDASSHFTDADQSRLLLSWFNKRGKRSRGSFSAGRSTTSTTLTELNSEIRSTFITWATEDVTFSASGWTNNNGGYQNTTACAFDSTTSGEIESSTEFGSANGTGGPSNLWGRKTGLSETATHYGTLLGAVQNGTGSWSASAPPVPAQQSLEFVIQG